MTMTDDQLTEWLQALVDAKPDLVSHDPQRTQWTVRFGDNGPTVEWDSRTREMFADCGDRRYTATGPAVHRSALAFAEGYAIGSSGLRHSNGCTAALEWLLDQHLNRMFVGDEGIYTLRETMLGYVYFDENGPAGFRGCSQLTGEPVEFPGVFPASFDLSEYD